MERACDACGRTYEARSKQSRYCRDLECDRARARARRAKVRRGGQVVELVAKVETLSVEATTRVELEGLGQLDTSVGQNALLLARRLDAAMPDSGSSVAALSKQHLAALAEARTAGAQGHDDAITKLRAQTGDRRLSLVR